MIRSKIVVLGTLACLAVPTVSLATPRASSTYQDQERKRHDAGRAFDGLLHTGWGEGEETTGAGSWIELRLPTATDVQSISIWPGNLESGSRSLREYSRPKDITVVLQSGRTDVATQSVRLPDGGKEGPARIDIPIEGKATTVRVQIDDAYEGAVFRDMFIAEIAINFSSGKNPKVLERLQKWRTSSSGEAAKKKHDEALTALYEKIKAEEFGDRESMAEIMDYAADGSPYLRRQSIALVPAGYRVQSLPPDDLAVTALLQLEDANGIPAIELASLRVEGKRQRELESLVEQFYALAELNGGGDRNIPYWGKSGWEQGAIRSFGEPLGIEMSQYGDLYVADLGNHRVQRFLPEGRVDRVWGGDPATSNVWFSGTRRWYVAGSAPGDQAGKFVNPVDIAMIPGKEADGFVVLDAKGRVQVFDDQGRPSIGWELRTDDPITAGVGGEGYIGLSKGRYVIVWGNEVYSFDAKAEELDEPWKIEDGVPNAAEVLKNGKLLLIFGEEGVMYDAKTGFRHGEVCGGEDELGPGVEDWDVTLDERGKLWAVTDTGWAIKYKKPGKVDWKVQISDVDLVRPRLAVLDNFVYVVERDRVLKIDALELKRKAELAEEEAAAGEGE